MTSCKYPPTEIVTINHISIRKLQALDIGSKKKFKCRQVFLFILSVEYGYHIDCNGDELDKFIYNALFS